MRTETVANSSKLWLAVSGANCGQKGEVAAALQIACERDLVWDRTTQKLDFAPLSRAVFARTTVSPKPAPRDPPRSYQPAIHNGSKMRMNEWDDGRIEIVYVAPRPDLHVAEGTVLFRGSAKGRRYAGTAYTLKPGCEPAPYPVSGARDDKKRCHRYDRPRAEKDSEFVRSHARVHAVEERKARVRRSHRRRRIEAAASHERTSVRRPV